MRSEKRPTPRGLGRVSLAIEPDLLRRLGRHLAKGSVPGRAMAVRVLMRMRLVEIGYERHASVLPALHVHLDHPPCLEVMARGAGRETFAARRRRCPG